MSGIKERFGDLWKIHLDQLTSEALAYFDHRRNLVPSTTEYSEALQSEPQAGNEQQHSQPRSLVACYGCCEIQMGGINGVCYRLWPLMTDLKQDHVKGTAEDEREDKAQS